MSDLDQLKARIADFVQRTGVTISAVGRRSCNDPAFVLDLQEGREPRSSTIKKVNEWMDLYDRDPEAAMGKSSGVGTDEVPAERAA